MIGNELLSELRTNHLRAMNLHGTHMNQQEQKIISLLLNEMAFEGAMEHFHEAPPDIPREVFEEIVRIEIPHKYDGNTESYRYVEGTFDDGASVYDNCYPYLRIIRNNIIHANKAYRPDTPERLSELLTWAEHFIRSVYETDSSFAARAREIKRILNIESF